jgi:hypothetical protein
VGPCLQVIVPENRLIVSEKAVLLDELAAVVRPGDLVDGRVGSTTDWGAFVECLKGGWKGGGGGGRGRQGEQGGRGASAELWQLRWWVQGGPGGAGRQR